MCKCVLSTCKTYKQIQESVRGEYPLRTFLGARRHDVACLVHAQLFLHVSYGFTTSTCDVRTPRAQHALPPRVFKKIPLSLVLCAAHIISALTVRGPCWLRTPSVKLLKKRTHFYRASTCSVLTTQKNEPTVSRRITACCSWSSRFHKICGCMIHISRQRQLWFLGSIDGSFYIYQPTATEINALATCVGVRTSYMSSAYKYWLRTLTWQSHIERTL